MEPQNTSNISQEAKFGAEELFFSITDKSSTILAGNDVFYRVSGYTKEELIGKYHNIIRHSDMPKIIFKALWDYIKNDKPIIAYVKNKAKDGSFYWVLAAVFPLKDRYISIRFKPRSPIFDTIRGLYLRLLIAEGKGGMEESAQVLTQQLSQMGFDSYDHFMSDALLLELKKKKDLVLKESCFDFSYENENVFFTKLRSMHMYSKHLLREYDVWFDKIDLFSQIKISFEEKGLLLRKLARDIVFLSLNASVSSYKVEQGGEAFGVLASDIRVNAKENDILIGDIDKTVQSLSSALHEIIFAVSCMHLQVEMINFFIEETGQNSHSIDVDEMINSSVELILLMAKDTQRLKQSQQALAEAIDQCLKYLDQLEQQMMYLGYIQIYGIIEAAANSQSTTGFGVIFAQLKDLIHQTSAEVELMQKMGKNFSIQAKGLIQKSHDDDLLTNKFRDDFLKLMHKEN